jgi:uncharacterized protein YjbJ (UPF0337 family)
MDERKRDLEDQGVDNKVRGLGKDVKGRIKDAGGGLTGDTGMQAEGKWDRIKGKVQGKVGDIQRRAAREGDRQDNPDEPAL